MYTTSETPSGGGSSSSGQAPIRGTERTAPAAPALRIRPGRMVLAATGLLALLTVAAGGILAAFTSVSWLLPLTGLAAAAGVVAALRSLAVRDRRRRMENAFRAAMGPAPRPSAVQAAPAADPAPAAEPGPAPETRSVRTSTTAPAPSVLFDIEAAPEAAAGNAAPAAPVPFTAAELRTEALKVAAAAQPAKPGTTPWEPVEVPKPVYVDAPKAERPAPEPIVLPETPRSLTKTPLRPGAAPAPAVRPETGKINLDDVLQRRRA